MCLLFMSQACTLSTGSASWRYAKLKSTRCSEALEAIRCGHISAVRFNQGHGLNMTDFFARLGCAGVPLP